MEVVNTVSNGEVAQSGDLAEAPKGEGWEQGENWGESRGIRGRGKYGW